MPSPTRSPAARSAASGAMPQPSRAFERGQWTTATSCAASRPISSSSRWTQCAAVTRSESSPDGARARGSTSAGSPSSGPRPERVQLDLGLALGEVRADREARARPRLPELERRGVRRVRRDPEPDAVRQRAGDAVAVRREARLHLLGPGPEDLEVDDRPQPELGAARRGGARVAAVADRGDARRRGTRPRRAARPPPSPRASSRALRSMWSASQAPKGSPSPKPAYTAYSRCECALTKPGQDRRALEVALARGPGRPRRSGRPPRRRARPGAAGRRRAAPSRRRAPSRARARPRPARARRSSSTREPDRELEEDERAARPRSSS